MRLKTIEIFGFKSFADKISLKFGHGITAIVGPNGCGKSNISDAFRWGLGAQSAKSMRGSKMPDVIFSGTAKRSPLNFAEVTITFTDVNGALPIDYEEVAITRRLHRSGDSDYMINKCPVRLKDYQSLFLDSGIGKDAFAIFEQGKIDQVINYSPLERRHIFEEAAGILRFLQRKREALKKLQETSQNVSRVKDILLEVETQTALLEKQAALAKTFKENKARLESLEKKALLAKFEALQKRIEEASKKEDSFKALSNASVQKIQETEEKLFKAKEALKIYELALKEKQQEVFKAKSQKEIKFREEQTHQQRLKELLLKEKRWQQEYEILLGKSKRGEEEKALFQQRQKELSKTVESLEAFVSSKKSAVHALEKELHKIREEQNKLQTELVSLVKSEKQLEGEIKQALIQKDHKETRLLQGSEKLQKINVQIKELSLQASEKRKEMEKASSALDAKNSRLQALEERLHHMKDELQLKESCLEKCRLDLMSKKARESSLLKIKEEMEGFSLGAKKLLKESSDQKSPLFGLLKGLYEYLIPQKGAESALAATLKPYAETLVVEKASSFKQVLSFAEKHGIKDFSLLCLENLSLKEAAKPHSLKALKEQVADHPLKEHFLSNAYMAENLEDAFLALKQSPCSVWTEQGSVDENSVVFFGTCGENNAFVREAELKSLKKTIAKTESEKESLECSVKALSQQKAELLQEQSMLDKSLRKDEMSLVEVNFALQRSLQDLKKAENEKTALEEEAKMLEKEIANLNACQKELEVKFSSAKEKALMLQQECEKKNLKTSEQMDILEQEKSVLLEKEASFSKAAQENRKLLQDIHIIDVRAGEAEQQQKRLLEEIALSKDLQSQIKLEGSEVKQVLADVEQTLKNIVEAVAVLEANIAKEKDLIESLEKEREKFLEKQKQQEIDQNKVSAQINQVNMLADELKAQAEERHKESLEEIKKRTLTEDPGFLTIPLETLEKQAKKLREEVENASDINMTSIEEFEKNKVRCSFLTEQVEDLDASSEELKKVIDSLDKESTEAFKETFLIIKKNFKKNFSILFNGGEADLQLTETQNLLEAGIEIIAKPPGKHMRSIQLLSGGEKCLTALALLFAIFEVKPAPFCILDEIDAPLDDSNVERFASMVKQFIDKCQFIVITHNKRTMAMADVLFGVSMEERGVSKVLSMELSQKSVEPVLV